MARDPWDGASAWLSLDETDSDIRVFLNYFVAAVRTVVPKACRETLDHLEAAELPPLEVLAGCLSNELDALGKPLVLALDDYHRLHEPAIHELLDHLLAHPPRSLHLAILSRRDPPLSLGLLRARQPDDRATGAGSAVHGERNRHLSRTSDRTLFWGLRSHTSAEQYRGLAGEPAPHRLGPATPQRCGRVRAWIPWGHATGAGLPGSGSPVVPVIRGA